MCDNLKEDNARQLFLEGYNCSQSVLLAFAGELGLDKNTASAISSSFGGGMGRLREVCGAVSGMFMAAGLRFGGYAPDDREGKKVHYARIQELARRFEAENGSIICRELLGLEQKRDEPTPEKRTGEYYKKRPCAELVACAAKIFDEYCKEQENSL